MDTNIPGALSIPKGAVPDRTRGFGHTAPTYVVGSRDRLSHGQGGTLFSQMALCMSDGSMDTAKASLRRRAHAARGALTDAERTAAAVAVAQNFVAHIPLDPNDIVAGYWRIRDELDCGPILAKLMARQQRVVLPVVMGPDQPLELRLWQAGVELVDGGFGTLAPPDHAPRAEPAVMLLPLVGFDAKGTRLGYGGGYYDRTLAGLSRKPRLIGLAFAAQELDDIPRGVHDVPLDSVITEAGVRHFGAA